MNLYTVQVAPNPTRVNLFIAEKTAGGVELGITQILVNLMKGEQKAPAHLARNSFGALPVLEVSPGEYLTESLAIMEYLDERFPSPSLIGNAPMVRARVRELERIVELRILQPIGRIIHATNSPLGLPARPEIADEARGRLPTGLAYVETLLGDGRAFLAGDAVTIADCTMAAALQFGRFRKVDLGGDYPNVLAWDARYRSREAPASVLIK